jgi:hypothetical protein
MATSTSASAPEVCGLQALDPNLVELSMATSTSASAPEVCGLQALDPNLVELAFSFLDARGLLLVSRTCKHAHHPAFAAALWRELDYSRCGLDGKQLEGLLRAAPLWRSAALPVGGFLVRLQLAGCELSSAAALEPCGAALRALDLSACTGHVGAALAAVLARCPALAQLSARNVPGSALRVAELRAAWAAGRPHPGLELLDLRGSFGDGSEQLSAAMEAVEAGQPLELDFLPTVFPGLTTLRLGWQSERPTDAVRVSRQVLCVSGFLLHGGSFHPHGAALMPAGGGAALQGGECAGVLCVDKPRPMRELALPGCQLLHATALLRAFRRSQRDDGPPDGGGSGSGGAGGGPQLDPGHVVSQLRVLNLACVVALTAEAMAPVLAHCAALRSLNIRCTGAGGCLPTVAAHCPRLTRLNASCTAVTPAAIRALADGCPRLRALDLCYPSAEETAQSAQGVGAVLYLARKIGAGLRMVGLGGFSGSLTDATLGELLSRLPRLRHLAVGGCAALGPAALDEVVCRRAPQLAKLNAHRIAVESTRTLERCLSQLPLLKAVDFEGVTALEHDDYGSDRKLGEFQLAEFLAKLKQTHPYDYDSDSGSDDGEEDDEVDDDG